MALLIGYWGILFSPVIGEFYLFWCFEVPSVSFLSLGEFDDLYFDEGCDAVVEGGEEGVFGGDREEGGEGGGGGRVFVLEGEVLGGAFEVVGEGEEEGGLGRRERVERDCGSKLGLHFSWIELENNNNCTFVHFKISENKILR